MRRRTAILAVGAGSAAALAAAAARRLRADSRAASLDPLRTVLEKQLEPRTITVTRPDGTRLNVEEFGPTDGAPIVLVHGWTCSLHFWTQQIQALSDEHRVIAYDLRGHGSSDRPVDGDYSIDAHADDLEAVLQAVLDEGERAVIAGHSMGAMTTVAWAGRHPESVDAHAAGVVLANTGMGHLSRDANLYLPIAPLKPVSTRIGNALIVSTAPVPRRSPLSYRITRHVAFGSSPSPAAVAFAAAMSSQTHPVVRGSCGRTLIGLDVYHALAALHVPAAVVAGGRDRMTPAVHAQRMVEQLPNVVSHVVVPHAGHMLPLSDAEMVTREIRSLVPQPSLV